MHGNVVITDANVTIVNPEWRACTGSGSLWDEESTEMVWLGMTVARVRRKVSYL